MDEVRSAALDRKLQQQQMDYQLEAAQGVAKVYLQFQFFFRWLLFWVHIQVNNPNNPDLTQPLRLGLYFICQERGEKLQDALDKVQDLEIEVENLQNQSNLIVGFLPFYFGFYMRKIYMHIFEPHTHTSVWNTCNKCYARRH